MIRSAPRTLLIILLLWLAGLGAAGQFAKFAVPFALMQAQYPQAGAQTSWLLSMITVTGVILGLTGGTLVARLGFVRPLIAAMLLGAGLSLWQSRLPPLPVMLSLRLIEGLSHLVIVIAAPTLIGIIAPHRWRGTAMTLWSTFFGVAFALTALIGLPLAESHGLAPLLSGHAVWMAGTGLLLIPALAGTRPPAAIGAADSAHSLRTLLAQHRQAYGSAMIAAPGWGWLFYTTTFVAVLAILPPLLPDAKRAAITATMPLLSIAVSLLLAPVLLRFWAATTVAITGFTLGAAITLAGVLGLPLPVLCLSLFAVLGLVQGGSFAAVPQLNTTAADQALANGVMVQMGNLGNMLGTPLLLAVLSGGGLRGLMLMLMALYLAGALVHQALARRRRRFGN